MAEIVLAFAASHGPTMNTKPEDWLKLGEKDVTDPHLGYANLKPKANIEDELALDVRMERGARIKEGLRILNEKLKEANPDVIVVFSNPHAAPGFDRFYPMFGIHVTDAPTGPEPMESRPGANPGDPPYDRMMPARDARDYPMDGDLARYLMNGLVDEGIDVAVNYQKKGGAGIDGAYHLLYQKFDTEGRIPHVPVLISRIMPHQGTPKRVYEFGQAIRRVIEGWDSSKRVAVMGSGGLSHQIIDEELDHQIVDGLQEGDTKSLFAIDRERLNGAPGTPESLNWLACAGVMSPNTMTLVDYLPCYRSPKGTGHGNTFGYWEP